MFDSTRFLVFLTAAGLLAIAPGPGMLYVLARSLAGGKREGVLSAFGTLSVRRARRRLDRKQSLKLLSRDS
jgi:threonine/homoserine/homoserine lactone efflux protein